MRQIERTFLPGLLLMGVLGGCSPAPHAAPDSGADAGRDAGDSMAPDSGADAGRDAGDGTVAVSGPLEGLPSEPGSHIDDIAALGDNEWLALGPPAADPEWGEARGRAWGARSLIPAPALRGAFFYGEGVHKYVKPDGHIMDDLWFYDANQHRWICVHPGTEVATFNQKVADGDIWVDEYGQIRDANDEHLPIHTLIHAWDFLTYDTRRQRFAFWGNGDTGTDGLSTYYLGGYDQMEEGVSELQAQRELYPPQSMSPWYYDVEMGAFLREPANNETSHVGSHTAFVYIPEMDMFLNAGAGGVRLYDPSTNQWTVVDDSGPRPPGYDHGVAYDPTRMRIHMGLGVVSGGADPGDEGMYIYDLQTETWSKAAYTSAAPYSFGTNSASIMYDSANDRVVILHYSDGVIYVYDPNTDTWTADLTLPTEVLDAVVYPSYHAFYDDRLNAYFVYVAQDSRDNGSMWAYRYKQP